MPKRYYSDAIAEIEIIEKIENDELGLGLSCKR